MAFLRNLTCGWPRLTPAWPLTPAMSYTLIRGSSYQIWWSYSISKQFALWLTQADPAWPLTPAMHYALVRGSSPKFGGHRALLSKLTLLDPSWPLCDLWPQQCITLWSRILPTKFGGHRSFLSNLTPGWPQMTPAWPFDPSNAWRSSQGFFPPNLVAIGHC